MNRRRGVGDSSDEEDYDASPEVKTEGTSSQPNAPPHSDDETRPSNDEDEGSGDDAAPEHDSSSEGSDDDESEMAEVREGFIVDSDDDEEDSDSGKKRRKARKRRRHPKVEEDIQLDEDDLDLLGASKPAESEGRFKRLKKATRDQKKKGLDNMFDDAEEEEEEEEEQEQEQSHRARGGEFDDFIEADEFSEDEDEKLRRQEEREIGLRKAAAKPGLTAIGNLAGLNEEKLSEIYDVFGDGDMYDWALAGEDDLEGQTEGMEDLQITDVFEPSELSSRMLTEEDNVVRVEDLPERYQILRNKLNHPYELDSLEYVEKKQWIGDAILKLKDFKSTEIEDLCRQAINSVVDFIAKENLEVPFIWFNRQDYLVHFSSVESSAEKTQLLSLDDLWSIVDLDMDFHALTERRRAARNLANLVNDTEVASQCDEMLAPGVEYQDLIEYLQFTHSSTLRNQKRHSRFGRFDRIRESNATELISMIGVAPDQLKYELRVDRDSQYFATVTQETPRLTPREVADEIKCSLEDAIAYATTALNFDPVLRKYFRHQFNRFAKIDLVVTDDGKKKITSNSPFADLKYSCNWQLSEVLTQPALFLRMLKAEEQGLLIVRAQYPHYKSTLYKDFERLLGGDVDSPWGQCRGKIAKEVSRFVVPLVARNVLESLRADCIRLLRSDVRYEFGKRLDQAPYKPPGYVLGTIPRVMCISAGEGGVTDAVLATIVDEEGHVSEAVKLGDARSSNFGEKLIAACRDAQPDVVGVAGFTPVARRLFQDVKKYLIDQAQLTAGPDDAAVPLEVVWVNDEVARLYRNSTRAAEEFPDLVPNARYCVACARYIQGPLLEYVQLNTSQLRSLPLHENQFLLPDEDFQWAIETSFVDFVCSEGVDINNAVRSSYHSSLLPYIAGFGPRKAQGITQALLSRARGGRIITRSDLVTNEITTSTVFMNCASFIRIPWSSSPDDNAEYLDSTRVHPEDYELARKMCADALEYDEEDVVAVESNQTGGIVAKLLEIDPEGSKLDELVLEEYASELEQLFKLRKRVTLNQIRQEIQDAYSEKRDHFRILSSDDVFTMLTGQTRSTFSTGLVVSAVVKHATGRKLFLNLSGGIDGVAESGNISDDKSIPLQQQFAPGQAVQAEIITVDYSALYAEVNTRVSAVNNALKRLEARTKASRDPAHWNEEAEFRDLLNEQRRAEQRQRQLRVVKHPLFKPFSAQEAENYLAPLQRGDLVIRPSSKGTDHLVVTWKVSEQIYQHVDVRELEKPNEYAVGRVLQVGPYRYSDLDELILMHIQAVVRKIDEVCASDKFQKGNRQDVERWLKAYTHARPTQSVYAFCFDHRRPGYLLLCFMLGANQPMKELHVRVLPNGYELLGNAYPDVLSLTNGFKMMIQRSKL